MLGAGTNFMMLPESDIGIVVLTNAAPVGAAEAVAAQFMDLVQFGSITRDWISEYAAALGHYHAPVGGDHLVVELGPADYRLPLDHRDGDSFSFVPTGENAPLGSLSSATFTMDGDAASTLTLQFFDTQSRNLDPMSISAACALARHRDHVESWSPVCGPFACE